MDNLDNKKTPRFYTCEICDFKSVNLKDYKRHCDTQKHRRQEMDNKKPQKTPKNPKLHLRVIIVKDVINIGQGYRSICRNAKI